MVTQRLWLISEDLTHTDAQTHTHTHTQTPARERIDINKKRNWSGNSEGQGWQEGGGTSAPYVFYTCIKLKTILILKKITK